MLVAVPLKHGNGGSAPQQVEAPPSLVGNDLPRLRGGVAVLVAGSLAGQGCIEAATIKIGEDEPDGEDRAKTRAAFRHYETCQQGQPFSVASVDFSAANFSRRFPVGKERLGAPGTRSFWLLRTGAPSE